MFPCLCLGESDTWKRIGHMEKDHLAKEEQMCDTKRERGTYVSFQGLALVLYILCQTTAEPEAVLLFSFRGSCWSYSHMLQYRCKNFEKGAKRPHVRTEWNPVL